MEAKRKKEYPKIMSQQNKRKQEKMENNTFTYQYSATRNREVENIRRKYMPQEENKLKQLKKLDARVQNAGVIEGLCLGIIGALVFGVGMCFFLNVFAGASWLSALFMIIGTLFMIPAYPICKQISKKAKAKHTLEILRLSEEIMNS